MPTERRHGGKRQGQPGKSYPNRRDLSQAPRAVPGQTYGNATEQMAAQRVVPLRNVPAPSASPSLMAAGQAGGGGAGELPSLTAPSTRPNEPLTAGLPTGPGVGPEALGLPGNNSDDELMAFLQAAYRAMPNDDIARMMAALDARNASQPVPKGQALGLPKPRTPERVGGGGKGFFDRVRDMTESNTGYNVVPAGSEG